MGGTNSIPAQRPKWMPSEEEAEKQILMRCKWLSDEWDRIKRDYIDTQRATLKKENFFPEYYKFPPSCFVFRMIRDYPDFYSPKIPKNIDPNIAKKQVEDNDHPDTTSTHYKWVDLDTNETELCCEFHEYLKLLNDIKKKQYYVDGVHNEHEMIIKGKLANQIIEHYRTTYIDNSSNMRKLAQQQMENEWKLASGN